MNDTLNTLFNHVSVREYTDQKVSEDVLNQILKAACNGSTMGNMQLFSIIVTEDEAMKQKLAPFHFNQPMATQAPLILTFCADFRRFNRYCEFRDAETEAYSNLQSYQWAILAKGPPWTNAGVPSSVWTRLGLSASLRSAAIAPCALSWPQVTGSPA